MAARSWNDERGRMAGRKAANDSRHAGSTSGGRGVYKSTRVNIPLYSRRYYSRGKKVSNLPKIPCGFEQSVHARCGQLPALIEQHLPGQCKISPRMPAVAAYQSTSKCLRAFKSALSDPSRHNV